MTNERAIELLNRISDSQFDGVHGDERREALGMAVRALEGDGDTISRKMAIDVIDAIFPVDPMKTEYAQGIACGAALAKTYIKQLPPAQPEIIRCKECEHWDTSWQNDYAPNYHYCSLVDGTRRDDFYCADAERRGKQNG